MLDRWNAHDLEGHLGVYWKSPELPVVVSSEQFNAWQQLHDSYVSGYPGPGSTAELGRMPVAIIGQLANAPTDPCCAAKRAVRIASRLVH
jgi:hypothetical protein